MLHTCWISIQCEIPDFTLPADMPQDVLKDTLTNLIKEEFKDDDFHSIKVDFQEKHQKHQCFVNFYSEEKASAAVQFFNKKDIHPNLKLWANLRKPKAPAINDTKPANNDAPLLVNNSNNDAR